MLPSDAAGAPTLGCLLASCVGFNCLGVHGPFKIGVQKPNFVEGSRSKLRIHQRTPSPVAPDGTMLMGCPFPQSFFFGSGTVSDSFLELYRGSTRDIRPLPGDQPKGQLITPHSEWFHEPWPRLPERALSRDCVSEAPVYRSQRVGFLLPGHPQKGVPISRNSHIALMRISSKPALHHLPNPLQGAPNSLVLLC